jgi:hypothetical protein
VTDGPVIDGRDLLPPEPFMRVMAALEVLAPDQVLTLLLYREPFPLFAQLGPRGYQHSTSLGADGTFTIRIWKTP